MGARETVEAPAQIAKGALRRLAAERLEPTPENYARAYAEESGQPARAVAPDTRALGQQWAALVERLVRGLDRIQPDWTPARKKDSLWRVLDGNRADLDRLQRRLRALVGAWEGEHADDPQAPGEPAAAPAAAAPAGGDWPVLASELTGALRAGLPAAEARAAEIDDHLSALAAAIAAAGLDAARLAEAQAWCARARGFFAHRHHLVEALGSLVRELSRGLAEMSEDASWVRGQCEAVQAGLGEELSVRSVRAAGALLAETRVRQQPVRDERNAARDALRQLFQRTLSEIDTLDEHTGRFHESLGRHAAAIEGAGSLQSLAGVVGQMIDDSRAVRAVVAEAQVRLSDEQARAEALEARVRALETELRSLSDEVSTDSLTRVANRRGLAQAFEAETARAVRSGEPLAVGLIDIDNFKRINDTMGHAGGDQALQALAAAVRERLRPTDRLARFGGEEFVVLLPGSPLVEAQRALTRLQRSLTQSLFLHEGNEVFVTFSAGVALWRAGETLEAALERADEALYEAKRAGKNRTCAVD